MRETPRQIANSTNPGQSSGLSNTFTGHATGIYRVCYRPLFSDQSDRSFLINGPIGWLRATFFSLRAPGRQAGVVFATLCTRGTNCFNRFLPNTVGSALSQIAGFSGHLCVFPFQPVNRNTGLMCWTTITVKRACFLNVILYTDCDRQALGAISSA